MFDTKTSDDEEEQAESEHVLRTVLPQHCRTALGVHEELCHVPEKKMIDLQQQRHSLSWNIYYLMSSLTIFDLPQILACKGEGSQLYCREDNPPEQLQG